MNQKSSIEYYAAYIVTCDYMPGILHVMQVVRVKQTKADVDEVKERKGEQN